MRTIAEKPQATQQTTAKSAIPGRSHVGQSRSVNPILHLQRAIGNQAAQRLSEANTGDIQGDSTYTGLYRFGHDFSRIPIRSNPSISSPTRQRVERETEIGELVHTFSPVPTSSRETWRAATTGVASPVPQRAEMEELFGHDFSRVQVHFGRVAELDALDAHAATDGERVAFASQAPSTWQVAHELAHVVQMRRGGVTADGSRVSEPGSPAEREAGQVAHRVNRGEMGSPAVAAPASLHRDLKSGNLEVPNGFFRIDMTKQEVPGGKSGEDGHIHFRPKPAAPDSDRIRLSQAVEVKDLTAGTEFNWAAAVPAEANRDVMQTSSRRRVHNTKAGDTLDSISTEHFGSKDQAAQIGKDNDKVIRSAAPDALADTTKPLPADLVLQILGAVKGGYFIDHRAADAAAKKRTGAADPVVLQDYVWPTEHGLQNHDGHKRAPTFSRRCSRTFRVQPRVI